MGRTAIPNVLTIQLIHPLLFTILCSFNNVSGNKFPTECIANGFIFNSYDKMQLYGILGQPSYLYFSCFPYWFLGQGFGF